MRKATKFIILRDVEVGMKYHQLDASLGKPKIVATLLNESLFNEDNMLIHNRTVFLEDFVHDWNYDSQGRFRYYTRIAEKADVLIVYEWEEAQPTPRFDPMTGVPLQKV